MLPQVGRVPLNPSSQSAAGAHPPTIDGNAILFPQTSQKSFHGAHKHFCVLRRNEPTVVLVESEDLKKSVGDESESERVLDLMSQYALGIPKEDGKLVVTGVVSVKYAIGDMSDWHCKIRGFAS